MLATKEEEHAKPPDFLVIVWVLLLFVGKEIAKN